MSVTLAETMATEFRRRTFPLVEMRVDDGDERGKLLGTLPFLMSFRSRFGVFGSAFFPVPLKTP